MYETTHIYVSAPSSRVSSQRLKHSCFVPDNSYLLFSDILVANLGSSKDLTKTLLSIYGI